MRGFSILNISVFSLGLICPSFSANVPHFRCFDDTEVPGPNPSENACSNLIQYKMMGVPGRTAETHFSPSSSGRGKIPKSWSWGYPGPDSCYIKLDTVHGESDTFALDSKLPWLFRLLSTCVMSGSRRGGYATIGPAHTLYFMIRERPLANLTTGVGSWNISAVEME